MREEEPISATKTVVQPDRVGARSLLTTSSPLKTAPGVKVFIRSMADIRIASDNTKNTHHVLLVYRPNQ